MNVLLVGPGDVFGGVETHIASLIEGAGAAGINYQLAKLGEAWEPMPVKTHLLRKRFRGDIRIVFKLASILKRESIDVMHTHMPGADLYGRLAALLVPHVGVVTTLHFSCSGGVMPLGREKPNWIDEFVLWTDLAMAHLSDRIITPNEGMRASLSRVGVKGAKVVTVRHGVDLERLCNNREAGARMRREWGLPADAVVAGTLGRMAPVKNYGLFLRAIKPVLEADQRLYAVLIGDGLTRAALEAEAFALGIAERVRFPGYQKDVAASLSALDIMVICSNSEMSPYAAWEGMAVGRALITTSVGALSETITHGVDGMLVPPGEERSLSAAITELASDDLLRRRMGRRARETAVRNFSRDAMMRRLTGIYTEVMIEKRARHARR